jgi:hypothetical protein
MRSSNEVNIPDLMKKYFRMIYRPSEVVADLSKESVNIVETFLIVIISSVLLIAGVFIVGDALYTVFHNYAYSYPLEVLTSGQIFGYYLPFSDYILVFITDIIFGIKAWLFLSVLLFVFLRVFKQQVSIKRTTQIIAWSIFPFAIVMFIASLICLALKNVLPLIYHYIYFGVLAGVFLGVSPIIVYYFLEHTKDVSMYNVLRSYYLSLFVVFVIFTINHADKILGIVW